MRYIVRKPGLFKKRYVISDQSGAERYRVDTTMFGDKYELKTHEGGPLIDIIEHGRLRINAYEFIRNGQTLARMPIHWLHNRFNAELPNGREINIGKNFWGTRYEFNTERGQLAKVSMAIFSTTKVGEIDIRDGEDEVLLLAIFVAMDTELSRNKGGNGS